MVGHRTPHAEDRVEIVSQPQAAGSGGTDWIATQQFFLLFLFTLPGKLKAVVDEGK